MLFFKKIITYSSSLHFLSPLHLSIRFPSLILCFCLLFVCLHSSLFLSLCFFLITIEDESYSLFRYVDQGVNTQQDKYTLPVPSIFLCIC